MYFSVRQPAAYCQTVVAVLGCLKTCAAVQESGAQSWTSNLNLHSPLVGMLHAPPAEYDKGNKGGLSWDDLNVRQASQ
jgi:hypothetical protein